MGCSVGKYSIDLSLVEQGSILCMDTVLLAPISAALVNLRYGHIPSTINLPPNICGVECGALGGDSNLLCNE